MLAHQNQVDTGNNLLKIADGPVMMSAESYESELAYHQHVPGRIELGLNEQSHYYQHEGYDHQQQQHFHNNGHPGEIPPHNLHPHHQQQQQHHPHQVVPLPQQEYYQQQQMMYNQGMSNYSYPSDQYYYQQHPPSNVPPGSVHHGPYPFQPSQSVIVNNGPASHGSHNCTPSPHANSDDSGGDCVNEPKMMQVGATSVYGHHGGLPYPNHFNPDPLMSDRTGGQKALLPSANMNRNLTAPRRGKKSKHRDPNEPQKPVSAYALFFRDTQAGIKMRNPNSSFGDVSKHVASLWDGLDPENKAVYKRRTETAKKEYLKSLAAYRASLVSKGGSPPCNPGPEPLATRYPENAMQSDRKEMLNLKDISVSTTSPNSQTLLGSPPSSYQPLGVIGRTSPQSHPVSTPYNSQVMFARTLSVQNGDNTSSHYNYQQPLQNLTHHQAVPHGGNNNPQFVNQHQPQLTKLT